MITIIIQARMGSSRFPGKMLASLGEKPLIWQVISRVKKVRQQDKIVLATSTDEKNKPLIEKAKECGVDIFVGNEDDVLDRYYKCAKRFGAKTIVRITGDCPLNDPKIIDKVITLFKEKKVDYATNTMPPTYPDGMDVEVFSFNALEKAWKNAKLKSEREHVTPYIRNSKEFKHANLRNSKNLSHLRLTVDEKEDLEFLNILTRKLKPDFTLNDIINILDAEPNLININNKFKRNEGYEKSLKEDEKMKFDQSTKWLAKAKKVIPTASQTYSKSYRYWCEGAGPAFLDHGKEGHVWDVDGNEYVDFLMGLGAVSIGYDCEEVNKAVISQIKKGVSFTQSNILEVELAEKLVKIIPCAEMVRFVKNGSDATTSAVRLARAFTGRDIIACCGYHGYHDWYIGTTTNDLGVPEEVKKLTKKFEYNNIDSLNEIFEKNKGKVAAVILEPCQKKGPENDFLEKIKELTHKNGAVLIFDEVVSGFRMALGGAQEYYGVTPDLSAIGKGLGNGFSISAVLGKREIMKQIDDRCFISTTFGGETTSLIASLETIKILEKPDSFKHIFELSEMWMTSLERMIKDKKLGEFVNSYGIPPHCGVTFNKAKNLESNDLMSVYQQSLIDDGILSVGVNIFCLTHTKEDVKKLISATDKGFDKVKYAIEKGNIEGFIKGEKYRPIFRRR